MSLTCVANDMVHFELIFRNVFLFWGVFSGVKTNENFLVSENAGVKNENKLKTKRGGSPLTNDNFPENFPAAAGKFSGRVHSAIRDFRREALRKKEASESAFRKTTFSKSSLQCTFQLCQHPLSTVKSSTKKKLKKLTTNDNALTGGR